MNLEIERRFLVRSEEWRNAVIDRRRLRDGLIVASVDSKVRVRIADCEATLTVKGPRTGCTRVEYEYPIPLVDAEELLNACCGGRVVEKNRYRVLHDGDLWDIDVYVGGLAGIQLAEIELAAEEQPFSRPSWLGVEVTGDPRFSKQVMMQRFLEGGTRACGEGVPAGQRGFVAHAPWTVAP